MRFLAILEAVCPFSLVQPIKSHGNPPLITLSRSLKEANLIKTKLRPIPGRVYLLNKDFGVRIVGSSQTKNDIVNVIKLHGDGRTRH